MKRFIFIGLLALSWLFGDVYAQVIYTGCYVDSLKNSSAIGFHSYSKGESSFAAGCEAGASGDYSFAFGHKAKAGGIHSFATGFEAGALAPIPLLGAIGRKPKVPIHWRQEIILTRAQI